MTSEATNIRVAVRCRPFNSREKNLGAVSCVKYSDSQLTLTDPSSGETHNFGFDILFDQNSLQTSVWDKIGAPILDKSFLGFNGTIFACKYICDGFHLLLRLVFLWVLANLVCYF